MKEIKEWLRFNCYEELRHSAHRELLMPKQCFPVYKAYSYAGRYNASLTSRQVPETLHTFT